MKQLQQQHRHEELRWAGRSGLQRDDHSLHILSASSLSQLSFSALGYQYATPPLRFEMGKGLVSPLQQQQQQPERQQLLLEDQGFIDKFARATLYLQVPSAISVRFRVGPRSGTAWLSRLRANRVSLFVV